MATGSTAQKNRVPRSAAQLIWTYDDPKGGEPPISARKLEKFEREWRQDLEIAATGCTASSCGGKVGTFASALELMAGISVSCTKKCVSKKVNGQWVKVCSFTCTGKNLSVAGWIR